MKRWKKKFDRITSELESEGIKVENNPDTQLILSGINTLSNSVLAIGLAIIGIMTTFGVALLSVL